MKQIQENAKASGIRIPDELASRIDEILPA